MTPQQQEALLTAARAAAVRLENDVHNRTCRYDLFRRYCGTGEESTDCTCGLWQTREALRAAIAGAGAEGGEAT